MFEVVTVYRRRWFDGYAALRAFVEREGHARVPQEHVEISDRGEVRLGWWITARRTEFRKGKLSQDRVDLLEAIPGWQWGSKHLSLEQRVEALRAFVLCEGHSDVPLGHTVRIDGVDLPLGRWVNTERRRYHRGELSQARVAAIESVDGWHWGNPNDRVEREKRLQSALLVHKEVFGHPWPAKDVEIEGIRPFHEIAKMQMIYRHAPHQPGRSEGQIARAQRRVEERWAALAELFSEYPENFPQSEHFFVNSALVASVAVELGGTDEDLRARELRSPETRRRADQARAIINSTKRPVAESAVASLRAIKGWSGERFSDWEARAVKQAQTAKRREEVRYARPSLAVWRACFSVAPDLLQDPGKPLYLGVFEERVAKVEPATLQKVVTTYPSLASESDK